MKLADRLLQQEKAGFSVIQPRCPYVGTCGGCTLQDLSYADQLALKRQRLLKLLGELDPSLTIDIVGLEDPWRYRNKAELTFGEHNGQLLLGYHAARSFWRIVDIDDCVLLPEAMSRVASTVRRLAQEAGQPAYNPKSHRGFFRYLIIRASHATGKLLACVMTTDGERRLLESLAEALTSAHPELMSVYWGVNRKVADVAIPDELMLLRGEPYLDDRIGPFALKLHPMNFLQPNPVMAQRMYDTLMSWLSGSPSQNVWDVYCGLGVVAFYLSSRFQTVYGIDSDTGNLEMGRLNAQANGLRNIQFHAGKAEDLLANKRFWLLEAKPEAVVVDPPRAGLHPKVIAALLAARPRQIAYVSCSPQALVRDLRELCSGFPRYRLCQATAFDMFPHTTHVEVLALLERA